MTYRSLSGALALVAACALAACGGGDSRLLGSWVGQPDRWHALPLALEELKFTDSSHIQVKAYEAWAGWTYRQNGDHISVLLTNGATDDWTVAFLPDGKMTLTDPGGRSETFVRKP